MRQGRPFLGGIALGCILLGCILLGLPGVPSPLAAPHEPDLRLRIDVTQPSRWKVSWTHRGAADQLRSHPAEPFHHEGLARREPPAGTPAGADRPGESEASARESTHAEKHRHGAFELRPMGEALTLDQTFAFPAIAPPARIEIEIVGLAPGIALETNGFEGVESFRPGAELRLTGQIVEGRPTADTGPGPLRLHLSTHDGTDGLARAIRAALAPPPPAEPLQAGPLDPVVLRSLMQQEREKHGGAVGSGRSAHDAALARLAQAMRLQAELDRRGWASRILFTNRRPVLALPVHPVFLFDAVLLDLPEAGLVLDPERGALLDRLVPHPDLAGKAVLTLAPAGASLGAFRPLTPADNHIAVRAELALDHDGVIQGQSRTEARGAARASLEQFSARLAQESANLVDLLRRQGLRGMARLGPREAATEHLSQHLEFELETMTPESGPIPIRAGVGPRLFRPPLLNLLPSLQAGAARPVSCVPQRLEQAIVLHLPDGRSLLDIPPDLDVRTPHARYRARYRLEQTHLHISRHLDIDPPGPLCAAELIREMAPALRAAGQDLDRPLNLRRLP